MRSLPPAGHSSVFFDLVLGLVADVFFVVDFRVVDFRVVVFALAAGFRFAAVALGFPDVAFAVGASSSDASARGFALRAGFGAGAGFGSGRPSHAGRSPSASGTGDCA
jgi:hypothetical protein